MFFVGFFVCFCLWIYYLLMNLFDFDSAQSPSLSDCLLVFCFCCHLLGNQLLYLRPLLTNLLETLYSAHQTQCILSSRAGLVPPEPDLLKLVDLLPYQCCQIILQVAKEKNTRNHWNEKFSVNDKENSFLLSVSFKVYFSTCVFCTHKTYLSFYGVLANVSLILVKRPVSMQSV